MTVYVLIIIFLSGGQLTYDYGSHDTCKKMAEWVYSKGGVQNAFCLPVPVPAKR